MVRSFYPLYPRLSGITTLHNKAVEYQANHNQLEDYIMKLYYIADEKMYCFDGKKTQELKSTVLTGYTERLYYNAKAQEWKTQGSGAHFTDTYDPYTAEDRLQNISVFTDCIVPTEDGVLFTQTIDGVSGLYIQKDGADDGIIFSDNALMYSDFDLYRNQIVIVTKYAGESHIAVCPQNSVYVHTLTEGETLDSHPVWSRFEENVIYYSSQGLEICAPRDRNEEKDTSAMGRMMAANQRIERNIGPAAIYRFDTAQGEITELLTNEKFDYLRPKTDKDGNLYFIKKPYRPAEKQPFGALGCLLDILLFPFRLCRALLGFLNIFSMVYSGKGIRKSSSAAAKYKDDRSVYLDGNMINAEKELKNNQRQGDKYPGIVPRSYELCRIAPNGETTTLKKGVLAFTVAKDGIYYSNGSAILRLEPNGEETLITKADRATQLALFEEELV